MKKQFYTSLIALILLAATASAQARFSSNTENYQFGQIEWKLPVTATFVVTNTGDQPLVLTEVEPDCACTIARWTQSPIAAGAKGTIEVTFDAKALGRFHKSVAIYTNATPNLVRLQLSGEVVREIKDFTRTHPYQIGDIRIDRKELDFPDSHRGEHPSLRIGVVNQSAAPYEPVLMHLPTYLKAEASPTVLQQGEKGVITLTLDTERLTDLGLTQASVYLSRFLGDKVGAENELPVSLVLLPDFSGLSETERANAPAIRLSTTEADLSAVLAKKSKARQDIQVTNTGRSALEISKLQVSHPAISVSLKKNLLQPGETTRLRLTVQKKNIDKARRPLRLLLITNDPQQPKVVINIKSSKE